ncbi:uncharacterized protein LOC142844264 [Microtus pennsylvanicus]|uniref:uncharacterized protein LOC142844264 n=1 Tax=Microtus pennsylvanicus TaxID=10058 RepID=UPI003F6B38E8
MQSKALAQATPLPFPAPPSGSRDGDRTRGAVWARPAEHPREETVLLLNGETGSPASSSQREDGEPEESVRGPSRSDFPDKQVSYSPTGRGVWRRGWFGVGGGAGAAACGPERAARRRVSAGRPRPRPSPASAPPRRGRHRPATRRDSGPRPSVALVPLPGDLRPVLQLSGPRRPRALSGSLGAGVPSAGALTAVLGVRRAALGSGIGRSPVRPGGTRFPGCPASAPRDGLPRRGSAQPAPVHPGALPKPLQPLQPLPPLPLALLPLRHAGDREPTTERDKKLKNGYLVHTLSS